jgi:dTDP-4-amino-4,6-dideoxygalactose transaminase
MTIAFIDLAAQRRRIADRIDAAIARVLAHGQFILGPEVRQFEQELSRFGGARHTLANANGTDALALPLMAWGIGEGDAVFCPSFTFEATAEVVPWFGATPVFVDVDRRTYTMDPQSLRRAVDGAARGGSLTPKAIIAVDLFGQPADYLAFSAIAREYGLKLIADSAQGFGCTLHGKHPLDWADCTTTSFFPAKPLGCYGDGGAILTNSDQDIALLRSLAVHGQGTDKYDNIRIGMNSRLDTIQAAILLEKLAIYADEIDRRNDIAARYSDRLRGLVATPHVLAGARSTWAQYTIETDDRDDLAAHLKARGIPTAIYYPKPLHLQTAYRGFPVGAGGMANSENAAARVLSLPMHAYLAESAQDEIAAAIRDFAGAGAARAPAAAVA